MSTRARVGLGVLVLAAAPAAIIGCFGSTKGSPGGDASFDVSSGLDVDVPDGSDDVTLDVTVMDAMPPEASVEAAVDSGTPPVDAAQPEAEAGPPVLEVLTTGFISPLVMAVDPSFIYVLESATPSDDSGYNGGVRRCPIGGCGANPPTVIVASASLPGGMALSGNTLFWSDAFQYILSCDVTGVLPCTGTQFVDMLDDSGGATFPTQLWVYGGRLYWFVDFGNDRMIATCPVTGCSAGYPKPVMYAGNGTTLSGTANTGLAIDGSYAYVSLFTGGPIYRYAMTSPESADITTETALGAPDDAGVITPFATHDLDLDGTWLRWADSNGTTVDGCTTPACNPIVNVATGRVMPYATRHDANYVYGVDQGVGLYGGVLWRLHK